MPERVLIELHELNENLSGIRKDLSDERIDRHRQIFWTRLAGLVVICILIIVILLREIDRQNELEASCIRGNESREAQNEMVDALRNTNAIHEYLLNAFDERVPDDDPDQETLDELNVLLGQAVNSANAAERGLRDC